MPTVSILHKHADVPFSNDFRFDVDQYDHVANIVFPKILGRDDTSLAIASDLAVRMTSNTEGVWSLQSNLKDNADHFPQVVVCAPIRSHFGELIPLRSTDAGDVIAFNQSTFVLYTGFEYKRILRNGDLEALNIDADQLAIMLPIIKRGLASIRL